MSVFEPLQDVSGDALYEHFLELANEAGVIFIHRPTLCDDLFSDDLNRGETCGLAHVTELEEGVPIGFVFLNKEPRTRVSYLMGLHEIGHMVVLRKDGKLSAEPLEDDYVVQTEEAKAWRWALAKAMFEPTPCEWNEIAWRMKSYRNKAFESLIAEAEGKANGYSTADPPRGDTRRDAVGDAGGTSERGSDGTLGAGGGSSSSH